MTSSNFFCFVEEGNMHLQGASQLLWLLYWLSNLTGIKFFLVVLQVKMLHHPARL